MYQGYFLNFEITFFILKHKTAIPILNFINDNIIILP